MAHSWVPTRKTVSSSSVYAPSPEVTHTQGQTKTATSSKFGTTLRSISASTLFTKVHHSSTSSYGQSCRACFYMCCSWELSPVTHPNTSLYLRVCFLEKLTWQVVDLLTLKVLPIFSPPHSHFSLPGFCVGLDYLLGDQTFSIQCSIFGLLIFIGRLFYLPILQGGKRKNLTSLLFPDAFIVLHHFHMLSLFKPNHQTTRYSILSTVGLRLLMVLHTVAF